MYYNLDWMFKLEPEQDPDEVLEDIRNLLGNDCDKYDEFNIDQENLEMIIINKKANFLYPVFARDKAVIINSLKRKRSPQEGEGEKRLGKWLFRVAQYSDNQRRVVFGEEMLVVQLPQGEEEQFQNLWRTQNRGWYTIDEEEGE